MSYWDYEEPMWEPSEADELFSEIKQKLIDSAKSSLKSDMEYLKNRNEYLEKRNKELEDKARTDKEYTECECRRWIIEEINQTTLLGFMHLLDEVLETVYENKNDLRNNKARMIEFLSRRMIE